MLILLSARKNISASFLRRSFNNSWIVPSALVTVCAGELEELRDVVTLRQSSTASDSRETFSRSSTTALFSSLNGRNAERPTETRNHAAINRLLAVALTCRLHEFPRFSRIACTRVTTTIHLVRTFFFLSLRSSPFSSFRPFRSGSRPNTIFIQPRATSFTFTPLPFLVLRVQAFLSPSSYLYSLSSYLLWSANSFTTILIQLSPTFFIPILLLSLLVLWVQGHFLPILLSFFFSFLLQSENRSITIFIHSPGTFLTYLSSSFEHEFLSFTSNLSSSSSPFHSLWSGDYSTAIFVRSRVISSAFVFLPPFLI